ncbi:cytochrome P450 [Ophiobolus disseminans]|uniref:Cytochrome P450 n=1 Tax=Ophiobolus disseminans TaxID=1469910 RepID=A0A6A6ZJN0_9PLEO|nr:cytochrome P450 [Ophiobolus disseminans]
MSFILLFYESFALKLVGTVLACSLYPLGYIIYNIYFHPLARFPGPKTWAAARLAYVLSLWSGWLHRDVQELHRKYGDIVRIAPDEISFARPDAYNDIYSNSPGRPAFPKSKLWHGAAKGRPLSVLNALDPKVHARFRKAMDPAFTEKALRLQEPVVQRNVEFFIAQLDKLASKDPNGAVVDIVQWFAFLAFDLVGDLGFGEPFGSLEASELHPWVELIFASIRGATYGASLKYYPGLSWLFGLTVPKSVMQKYRAHWSYAVDKINKRLEQKEEKADLISMIKRDDEGVKGITLAELHATTSLIIIAGSETTVSVLSGTVNYLVKNPAVLTTLTNEVRSTFKRESDVSLAALKELPYLSAVVQEGLRLCNPTPVGSPRVVPPEGGHVAGHWLPANTYVNVHPGTMSRSPEMFHKPEAFLPVRWLGEDPAFAKDQHNAVQAFSVGPRSCIGKPLAMAELRLILARLVWKFDLYEAGTEAGRLEWTSQRTFSVVERQPFDVRVQVRTDVLAAS